MNLSPGDALIATDVQNDFCPGGSLAVSGGETVAAAMTGIARLFADSGASVFATMDWHPPDHSSFIQNGGTWPPHCVQNTHGADLHAAFQLPSGARIIRKGSNPMIDAYSGFLDSALDQSLRKAGVTRVYVAGLATDYCVLNTVLDAVRLGFDTYVLTDAVAAVDINQGDGEAALRQMADAGAKLITSAEIVPA